MFLLSIFFYQYMKSFRKFRIILILKGNYVAASAMLQILAFYDVHRLLQRGSLYGFPLW